MGFNCLYSDHQLDASACAESPAVPATVHEREHLLYKAVKVFEVLHGAVIPSLARSCSVTRSPSTTQEVIRLRRTRATFRSRLRADPDTPSLTQLHHLRHGVCLYLDHAPRLQQGLRGPFGGFPLDGPPPSGARMRCPGAQCLHVLCLSPPLVALLLKRFAIRSGQSHPGLYTQPHQPGSGRRVTILARSDHSTATEEPVLSMTLPPTSVLGACHRVVRRQTCCSPVTRRSMRATQAREPRLE